MLLKPKIKLDRITEITVSMLKKRNIKALILDVDNTLSTHHGMVLLDGLKEWISTMQKNGIMLTVLSNSTEKRVKPFANKIGLSYISLGLKPLSMGFLRAIKQLNVKRNEVAVVGDQIFTDTLGGNILGLTTILLTPIKPETSLRFKTKRKVEKLVFKLYKIKKTEE